MLGLKECSVWRKDRSERSWCLQVCSISRTARPVLTCPNDHPLQYLYKALDFEESEMVDRHKIAQGLKRLGEDFASAKRVLFISYDQLV